MQEVFKNGSEGEVYVENTLEDLIPHIKKSLENPDVKFVKIFRAVTLIPRRGRKLKFTTEEEKKDLLKNEGQKAKALGQVANLAPWAYFLTIPLCQLKVCVIERQECNTARLRVAI